MAITGSCPVLITDLSLTPLAGGHGGCRERALRHRVVSEEWVFSCQCPYPTACIRNPLKENGICFFQVRMGKVYFGSPSDRRHCQWPFGVYIWVLCGCFQTDDVLETHEKQEHFEGTLLMSPLFAEYCKKDRQFLPVFTFRSINDAVAAN